MTAGTTVTPATVTPATVAGPGRMVRRLPAPSKRVLAAGRRPDLRLEKTLLRNGHLRLAAMDEVGRGALAGPVTVGVVVVTETIGRVPPGLRDSKLLTPAARDALVAPVRRWAKECAVGHASADEIDAVGIMCALRTAARRALAQLDPVDAVLLDGNYDYLNPPVQQDLFAEPDAFPPLPVYVRIKADLTCAGVAGASVLAKTERDRHLVDLAPRHPQYNFAVNKGYGTPDHLAALREFGPSEVHRRSWRLTGTATDADPDGAGVGSDDPAVEQFVAEELEALTVMDDGLVDGAVPVTVLDDEHEGPRREC